MPAHEKTVIPAPDRSRGQAAAGIQFVGLIDLKINQVNNLDSRLRGNDGGFSHRFELIHSL